MMKDDDLKLLRGFDYRQNYGHLKNYETFRNYVGDNFWSIHSNWMVGNKKKVKTLKNYDFFMFDENNNKCNENYVFPPVTINCINNFCSLPKGNSRARQARRPTNRSTIT